MRYQLSAASGALALMLGALPASAQAPARAPAPKPPGAAAAPAQPAPPPLFVCRTPTETCFLGIVTGTQVAILYTNAPNLGEAAGRPLDVYGADTTDKLDLSASNGRVVMLAGTFDPRTGIKGELVETAGPLASLVIKSQLGEGPDAAGGPKVANPKRR